MRIHMTLPTLWAALVIAAWIAVPEVMYAATTGPPMPWDGPLETIRDSLSGTVAHILVTVAIILTGILFALGEGGSAARRISSDTLFVTNPYSHAGKCATWVSRSRRSPPNRRQLHAGRCS